MGNEVNITVYEPTVTNSAGKSLATCQIHVESSLPLPRAPYSGTVRITGQESTPTGSYPCRLLRHYSVEYLEATATGANYRITIDVSREESPSSLFKSGQTKELAESLDLICRRVAGLFGRHCEQYKPPSVVVK